MPYKRRRFRRRRRRRRGRRSKSAMTIAKGPLFGKRKLVKFRYAHSGQLIVQTTPTGDKWGCETFGANAAGKPNVVNNELPAGWQNVAPLFKLCYTLSSKITVNFLPSQTAHSAIPWVEKSTVPLVGSLSPDANQVVNNRYVNWGLSPQNPGGSQKLQRSMTFSTKKWFSVNDVTDDDDLSQNTQSLTVPSPAREAFFNIGWVTTHPATSGTQNIDFFLVQEFLCVLVEPVNVS